MSLVAAQRVFLAEMTGDDLAEPSSTGMAIYRNGYRARLCQALASGFERTARWVGEDAFAAAATHYIISHPPASWTLDAFGVQFPQVLDQLFADDREVGELAWLEWHMQQAFAAPDCGTLDAAGLAALGLDESGWAGLRLTMAAGFAAREVASELAALWHGLAPGQVPPERVLAAAAGRLIVWRRGDQPHFRLVEPGEWAVLGPIAAGQPLGLAIAAIAEQPERFGTWLAEWIGSGLFSGFVPAE